MADTRSYQKLTEGPGRPGGLGQVIARWKAATRRSTRTGERRDIAVRQGITYGYASVR